MSGSSGGERPPRLRRAARSRAEWVTFAVASAVVLVVAGAIASLWISGRNAPPAFAVRTLGARPESGRFHVRARVENTGDQTAEGVQVVAELAVGSAAPEEGEQTIDFLAGGDQQEVEFVFTTDPAEGDLTVGVRSFKVP